MRPYTAGRTKFHGWAVHRTPVAKQNLVRNPKLLVFIVQKIAQKFHVAAKMPATARCPIDPIAGIEIHLEQPITIGQHAVGKPGEEGRTHALQKKKSTSHNVSKWL